MARQAYPRRETVLVGINSFGRIGTISHDSSLPGISLHGADLEIRAINHTCANIDDLVYLIRRDTAHGLLREDIDIEYLFKSSIRIKNKMIALASTRDTSQLYQESLGVEYVLECTASYKCVVISAPSLDAPKFEYSVKSDKYQVTEHDGVISSTSCTTNCLTPILKTNQQQPGHLSSLLHKSSTTRASAAVSVIVLELANKTQGLFIRVATCDVSIIDLKVATYKTSSLAELIRLLQRTSQHDMAGVLAVSNEFDLLFLHNEQIH
ncbi:putative glyceraldehyde-3-phosphate dehydrogenase [Xylaria acuta]|nr:putative glyceraldehyde-3-phosphate dehydrogenase [Xylaria acuta]